MNMLVFAQMMDRGDHMDNNNWWWLMGIVGLLIVIALIVVVVITLQRSNPPSNTSGSTTPGSPRKTAEDLLSERFARGEIDEDEYRRRRGALRD